jgi:hypothetical protein
LKINNDPPASTTARPAKNVPYQSVSVFGRTPPVWVVATGVGDSVRIGVADGVADEEALVVGVAEGVDVVVGVPEVDDEAVGVALGVAAAAHVLFVMVLLSRVTAPSRANS